MANTATNKDIPKKTCPICRKPKSISTGYYKTSSPLFTDTGCVPICITCVKDFIVNNDGTINLTKMKTMLQRLDKPYYTDDLNSSYDQYRREHSFLSDDEIARKGKDIIGLYFKNINSLRQTKDKSYADSEADGFIHQNSNTPIKEKQNILDKYDSVKSDNTFSISEKEPQVYSKKWKGSYSQKDLDSLDEYYNSLEKDYNIVTGNHRDYAKKIAKASLQMDKAFDDMMNGVEGADKKYDNATKVFDTLSKSAKFSESTRSVNDVGASSFSKVAAMVESHNWIPEHHPLEKDTIDEMIDYLCTITKSL